MYRERERDRDREIHTYIYTYAGFAAVYARLPDYHATLFNLLCLVYFVLYMGPNVATYVLPVLSFPADVLSTFHGLSSAAAKIGAMVMPASDVIKSARLHARACARARTRVQARACVCVCLCVCVLDDVHYCVLLRPAAFESSTLVRHK